jgi:hypothetical protein
MIVPSFFMNIRETWQGMGGTQEAKTNMFATLKSIWIGATDKGAVSCELYESFRAAFGYDIFVYLLVDNATHSLEERKKKKPSKASRRSRPSNVINIPDDDMNDRLDRIEKTLREIQHSQQRIEVALKIEGSSAALSLDADTIGQTDGKGDLDRDDNNKANFDDVQDANNNEDTEMAAASNESAKPEQPEDGETRFPKQRWDELRQDVIASYLKNGKLDNRERRRYSNFLQDLPYISNAKGAEWQRRCRSEVYTAILPTFRKSGGWEEVFTRLVDDSGDGQDALFILTLGILTDDDRRAFALVYDVAARKNSYLEHTTALAEVQDTENVAEAQDTKYFATIEKILNSDSKKNNNDNNNNNNDENNNKAAAQAAKPNTESAKANTKTAAADKESAKPDSKEEGTAANVTKIPCAAGAKCQCGGFIVTDPGKVATKHICRECEKQLHGGPCAGFTDEKNIFVCLLCFEKKNPAKPSAKRKLVQVAKVTKRLRLVRHKSKKSDAMTKSEKAKAKLELQEQAAKVQAEIEAVENAEETEPGSDDGDSSFSNHKDDDDEDDE